MLLLVDRFQAQLRLGERLADAARRLDPRVAGRPPRRRPESSVFVATATRGSVASPVAIDGRLLVELSEIVLRASRSSRVDGAPSRSAVGAGRRLAARRRRTAAGRGRPAGRGAARARRRRRPGGAGAAAGRGRGRAERRRRARERRRRGRTATRRACAAARRFRAAVLAWPATGRRAWSRPSASPRRPMPFIATASKKGRPRGLSRSFRISIGSALGRSRLLYWRTIGISSGSISLASRFSRRFARLVQVRVQHRLLAVGHEHDAVRALQHHAPGGVVEDLAGHGVELDARLHARGWCRARWAGSRRTACGPSRWPARASSPCS